ncbi:MAG: hypothetical protein IRY99_23905 [Isosphaeraceae bacterium]|nr:hypothetical protein [Isosphaeraceae bacterium]
MDAPAATEPEPTATACEDLERTLAASGPGAALDRLIAVLEERNEPRALLDALLLKARHDLGLPLIPVGPLAELPEPARTQYEERYIEAIRHVGRRLLAAGDIPAAWPYFRAIAESQPVAEAIEAYRPDEDEDGERLGQVIEVAFNQGAHPRKGWELILDHYGTCSAITAYEHLPSDEATRAACADRLVRHLHEQLVTSLRGEIARRGQPLPPEGAPIPVLLAGRKWLFDEDAYHIDVSHLAAVVRLSPLLADPATIALAVELTDYGRHLSSRHRYEGDPPFERLYEDHAVYLRALLGQGVDAAIAHFRAKLGPADRENPYRDAMPAQVLIRLLVRLGRFDEAIDLAAEHLAGLPESALACPSVAQLCQRAGHLERLAQISRERGHLVDYMAALLSK